jgi:pyruvate kinase
MTYNPRKTKIVCTLGPAAKSAERVRALIGAGMNVARLNFSHGDHEGHGKMLHTLRGISKDMGREIGILQDLGGPKIRLGKLPTPERHLESGERVVLRVMSSKKTSDIPVNYQYLLEDLAVGDRILLADGLVLLKAESKTADGITCEVLVGGTIHSHKGINLPSSTLRVPSFTEKDRKDLAFGLQEGVDFVALSFVRHERDLEPAREILAQSETHPLLIAKIEKPQAIERLEQILAQVDGVMVARGDLGVEMPLEKVPIIQKKIIRMARQAGKPVITATQMLRSMIDNPRPTRAEATDVANAILDGTDALMLSDETAIGEYPVEAVGILERIARATECHLHERAFFSETISEPLPLIASAIGRSACFLAEDLQASAIVAGTSSGSTARLISRFRPACPVLGLTPSPQTERQLTLSWGVEPALVAPFTDTDDIFELARLWALEHDIIASGDRLVVTAGAPVGAPGTTNLIKVMEIE